MRTVGTSLSGLAALAAPAAITPAKLPSTSNATLARGPAALAVMEIVITSLLE
jgi:hypothetical protein